jgi:hypothetical protein
VEYYRAVDLHGCIPPQQWIPQMDRRLLRQRRPKKAADERNGQIDAEVARLKNRGLRAEHK